MADTRRASGVTLIEAMAAMTVLLVGALGLASLHKVGAALNGDARVRTRATAIAQDLVAQMQTWDYANDPRLANTATVNDADFVTHNDFASSPVWDHTEAELEGSGQPWLGIPTATVQAQGFQRNWNIAAVDTDQNGAVVARRVAVIVGWQQPNGASRQTALVTILRDPSVGN